ncbi:uncharacterized protein ACNLHF_022790 [Anomaloglossus baeobatrachus]|uniref:uncharacterized protein LOC142244647 n=1 Tax=Anomaloglossus baeobatrachus TaxID=238106 RepID=UPI003F508B20
MEKLLLALVVATMVHARPTAPTIPEANPLELVMEAIEVYNGESHSDAMFRLYKDEYHYEEGPVGQKQANFTIKETVCQKSKNETREICEFNPKGLEKSCTALQRAQETFTVICSTVTEGTKKTPENREDAAGVQPEDEASYEDQVIIMDDNEKILVKKEDKEERRDEDAGLESAAENADEKYLVPRSRKKTPHAGQSLGRLACLECFFDIFT